MTDEEKLRLLEALEAIEAQELNPSIRRDKFQEALSGWPKGAAALRCGKDAFAARWQRFVKRNITTALDYEAASALNRAFDKLMAPDGKDDCGMYVRGAQRDNLLGGLRELLKRDKAGVITMERVFRAMDSFPGLKEHIRTRKSPDVEWFWERFPLEVSVWIGSLQADA